MLTSHANKMRHVLEVRRDAGEAFMRPSAYRGQSWKTYLAGFVGWVVGAAEAGTVRVEVDVVVVVAGVTVVGAGDALELAGAVVVAAGFINSCCRGEPFSINEARCE